VTISTNGKTISFNYIFKSLRINPQLVKFNGKCVELCFCVTEVVICCFSVFYLLTATSFAQVYYKKESTVDRLHCGHTTTGLRPAETKKSNCLVATVSSRHNWDYLLIAGYWFIH